MRRRMAPKLAQGQAGVYSVAAQLLLREINPSFPAVDCGADIITDWGTRIQVKSARRVATMWGGSYRFMLDAGVTIYTGGNGHKKTSLRTKPPRKFSDECDYFALWGIDDNRYWIVPSPLLDGKHVVTMVGPNTPWLTLNQDAMRRDHISGMSSREIAEKYGISKPTVLKILRNVVCSRIDMEFCKCLLKYENRWDLLLSEEQLLSEGEANNFVPATAEGV